MSWYENEDPFSHVGYARVIVIRHNPLYGYRGQLDNCTIIAHVEGFAAGFVCPEIKRSRYTSSSPCLNYIEDEVRDSCEHKINHLFKNKPNGIYELIGEVWAWSSQSYGGDWDGDSELRKAQIREISFDHAMLFDCESIELIQLKIDSSRKKYCNDMDISPYMTKQQILRNQANALSSIIEGSYRSRTNWDNSSVQELETAMFTLMLEIDSKNKDELTKMSQYIEDQVKYCLEEHEKMMSNDS